MEVDHRIPISRKGSWAFNNLGITSRFHNNVKGQLTEQEFRQLLKLISKWEDKGEHLLKRLASSSIIFKKRRY